MYLTLYNKYLNELISRCDHMINVTLKEFVRAVSNSTNYY